MVVLVIVAVGLLLAFANGANDNFKGVATLFGSGTTNYRRALIWGTATTAAGSFAAVFVARRLLQAFTGKGLVPPEIAGDPLFPAAVGLAAGVTVLLATRIGFPISTTHALIGALVGAGLVATPQHVDWDQLGRGFLLPLVISPLLAVFGAILIYPPLRLFRRWSGITRETCVCVGERIVAVVPGAPGVQQAMRAVQLPIFETGTRATCRVQYRGALFGVHARPVLDTLHYLSAGTVSFARGLNDTPKIAALLLVAEVAAPGTALVGVGVAMALGGLLAARRVAETMANRVTEMNPGQGFVANALTTALVVGASGLGLPVSTTHVSCGALFGIGAVTRQARWNTIGAILSAWVITLPLAAALAALAAMVLLGIS